MQPANDLTERERQILQLLASGASNKEIAQTLFITANTVKVHLRNIFAKIGVTSRTEAAIYALRENFPPPVESAPAPPPEVENSSPLKTSRRFGWPGLALLAIFLLAVSLAALFWGQKNPSPQSLATAAPTASRWQALAELPTARSGLALASYENQIYAIAGQTASGVTGMAEKYDVATDSWELLPPKPLAVADVAAAVIGGKIYLPGGRLASGEVTDLVEVYDPRLAAWESSASLPVALSGYALAAFEGKLYLFGGWDGQKFRASVYEYDPGQDQWAEKTPMPTARGFSAAALAGGKIYVMGGTAGGRALAVNEEYSPERDSWLGRAALPAGRSALAAASIADIIYVVGGEGQAGVSLSPLQYIHQQNQWQAFEGPPSENWSRLGLAAFQTHLYGMGGHLDKIVSAQNLSYQAIYTIMLPSIPSNP